MDDYRLICDLESLKRNLKRNLHRSSFFFSNGCATWGTRRNKPKQTKNIQKNKNNKQPRTHPLLVWTSEFMNLWSNRGCTIQANASLEANSLPIKTHEIHPHADVMSGCVCTTHSNTGTKAEKIISMTAWKNSPSEHQIRLQLRTSRIMVPKNDPWSRSMFWFNASVSRPSDLCSLGLSKPSLFRSQPHNQT